PFGTLPDSFVRDRLLSQRNVAGEQAAFLTQLAQGSLGSAIRYAEMGVYARLADVLAAVGLAADDPLAAGKALADVADDLSSDTESVEDEQSADTSAVREAQGLVIAMTSVILRDVQRMLVGSRASALPENPEIKRLAGQSSRTSIGQAIKALGIAEYEIGQ